MSNTINRRDFLKNTSLLALGSTFAPTFAFKEDEKPIGLQLWSVRDALREDFDDTIERIAKMGYNYVEGFGYENGGWFGKNPKGMKEVLKDWNLKMPSAHFVISGNKHFDTKTNMVTDEVKKLVEDSVKVGQRYLISPWMDNEDRKDLDTLKKFCEKLNKCGEYCKSMNLRFGYHNHWFEFDKVGGEMIYDVLLKNTDPQFVTMEMDVCWVTYSKQNPVEWFKKYPKRFELLHMKDLIDGAETHEDASCIIGKGVVDFEDIIANASKGGVKMYIAELETYEKSSVDDVKVCYKNLRKLLKK
jgi:sugar phosphate isomerase/epimerase